MIQLTTPIKNQDLEKLKAGDFVLISGILYTARDAAHQKLVSLIANDQTLSFDFEGQIIYYVGPTPAKPNEIIGSCGPTSSYRMDVYSLTLMKKGLKIMIGKGDRSRNFKDVLVKEKAVYLQALGGTGALLSQKVTQCEVIAFPELGTEAIFKLHVSDFPAIVTYDIHGSDLLEIEIPKYQKTITPK